MFTFVSDVFAVFVTVLVVNWNYRSPRTHTMPRWVRILFLQFLPYLLFLNRLQYPDPEKEEVDEGKKCEPPPSYFAVNQFPSDNEDAFIQDFSEGASLDITTFVTTDSMEGSLSNSSIAIRNAGNFYENLQTQSLTASESQMSDSSLESKTPLNENEVVPLKGQVKILKLRQSPHRIGASRWRNSSRANANMAKTRRQESFSLLEGLKAVEYISDRLEEKIKDRIVSSSSLSLFVIKLLFALDAFGSAKAANSMPAGVFNELFAGHFETACWQSVKINLLQYLT